MNRNVGSTSEIRGKKRKKKISHDQIDRERKEEAREKEKAVAEPRHVHYQRYNISFGQ